MIAYRNFHEMEKEFYKQFHWMNPTDYAKAYHCMVKQWLKFYGSNNKYNGDGTLKER